MNENINNEEMETVEGTIVNGTEANEDIKDVACHEKKGDGFLKRNAKKVLPLLKEVGITAVFGVVSGISAYTVAVMVTHATGRELIAIPTGSFDRIEDICSEVAFKLHDIEVQEAAEALIENGKEVIENIVE